MKPIHPSLSISALTPDEDVRRMFEPMRQEGVDVVAAGSLQEAAQAAVVFVDGDPVAGRRILWQIAVRQILEINSDTVVVLLSRLADERMWIEVLSSGAYDLLPKASGWRETRCVVLGALERAAKLAATTNQKAAPKPWIAPARSLTASAA